MNKTKQWPTKDDLLCWFIFRWIDEYDCDSPEKIKECLMEFQKTPSEQLHEEFYEEYEEFQQQFLQPGC